MSMKEFSPKHLMTTEELISLMREKDPLEQANILTSKLSHYCIIKNKSLYMLQSNGIYKVENDRDDMLLYTINKLITKTIKSYDGIETTKVMNIDPKKYASLRQDGSIKKYLSRVNMQLKRNDINFDTVKGQIHFNDGYYDLETYDFKERDGTQYVTKCISRNYKESTKAQRNVVRKIFEKIYVDKKDLDIIFTIISMCLSGEMTKENYALFLLGTGSGGKSTLLKTVGKCIDIYFKELKSDAFSSGTGTSDKTFNSYHTDPQILLTWVNEMDEHKVNTTAFKKFTEGSLTTSKLYSEGSHSFEHRSGTIVTANCMPNIPTDSGTRRRVKAYTMRSKFVDFEEDVNKDNHVYLKDKDIEMKLDNNLHALFDILIEYYKAWKSGEYDIKKEMHNNNNFNDTTETVNHVNDTYKDFVDAYIIKTGKDDDFVSKNEMLEAYNNAYPGKTIKNHSVIVMKLKDHGLTYNCNKKKNKVKGVFVGLQLRDDDDTDEEENDDLGLDYTPQTDYKKRCEELEAQVAELKRQLNKAKMPETIETKALKKAVKKKANKSKITHLNLGDLL